jgi:hypothetical protein
VLRDQQAKVNVLREMTPTSLPTKRAGHLPLQEEAGGGRVDAVHFGQGVLFMTQGIFFEPGEGMAFSARGSSMLFKAITIPQADAICERHKG